MTLKTTALRLSQLLVRRIFRNQLNAIPQAYRARHASVLAELLLGTLKRNQMELWSRALHIVEKENELLDEMQLEKKL